MLGCRAPSSPSGRSTSSTSGTSASSSAPPPSATGWSSASRPTRSTCARRAASRSSARASGSRSWPPSSRSTRCSSRRASSSSATTSQQYGADVLVMGDDWAGRFDEFEDVCEVVYLPRTPAISTTALIEKISATGLSASRIALAEVRVDREGQVPAPSRIRRGTACVALSPPPRWPWPWPLTWHGHARRSPATALEIRSPETAPAEPADAPTPTQVLRQAEAALEGEVAGTRRPEATLALRDLFVALPRLSRRPTAREARRILARPTTAPRPVRRQLHRALGQALRAECVRPLGARGPRHAASRRGSQESCVSWRSVWRKEVGQMGYRRPVKDGRRGGNGKFDVYLNDVGAKGLFGYCAPEFTKPGFRRLASGYCVLDNDFARSQFGAKPADSLKVTAAHEFFHAVQFAYDYLEDPWLMEATATWIEERYADGVNDNRQYLPAGQLVRHPPRARHVRGRLGDPVRQLGVLRVPLEAVRRQDREADLDAVRSLQGRRQDLLDQRRQAGAAAQSPVQEGVRAVLGRQHHAGPLLPRGPVLAEAEDGRPGRARAGRGYLGHAEDRPHVHAQLHG